MRTHNYSKYRLDNRLINIEIRRHKCFYHIEHCGKYTFDCLPNCSNYSFDDIYDSFNDGFIQIEICGHQCLDHFKHCGENRLDSLPYLQKNSLIAFHTVIATCFTFSQRSIQNCLNPSQLFHK